MNIPIELLELDPDIQPRAVMSQEAITEYAELYQSIGAEALPPIDVFAVGDVYLVAEGFHRVLAARRAELDALPANVHQGDREDALWFASSANQGYGVRRTNKDKRLVVERVLKTERWARRPDTDLAEHCGVSRRFVDKVRSELSRNGAMIATPVRLVTRNNSSYEMNTARIGGGGDEDDDMTPTNQLLTPEPFKLLGQEAKPPPSKRRSAFNRTNEMVDWASWTWNPVTGCEHDCPYCYARDIAENGLYKEGFLPTFRPERLKAPQYTKVPAAAAHDIGERNVFVCSMGDLFGKWVPQEWINAVMAA